MWENGKKLKFSAICTLERRNKVKGSKRKENV